MHACVLEWKLKAFFAWEKPNVAVNSQVVLKTICPTRWSFTSIYTVLLQLSLHFSLRKKNRNLSLAYPQQIYFKISDLQDRQGQRWAGDLRPARHFCTESVSACRCSLTASLRLAFHKHQNKEGVSATTQHPFLLLWVYWGFSLHFNKSLVYLL